MRGVCGATPLHLATGHNDNPAVAEVLLEAGADITARDAYGWYLRGWNC